MPINVEITTKGFDKAMKTLTSFSNRLSSYYDIKDGLLFSGIKVRDALNSRVPAYAGKAEVYQISSNEVIVGPSTERILEIEKLKPYELAKVGRKCLWDYYRTYVLPSERLPVVELDPSMVRHIVSTLIPTIKDIMITAIKRGLE